MGLLDGGEIAVEVEIDIRVRADAGATAAGGAALEAEDRAEGRLAEDGGGAFAEAREGVAETDSGGGLALAGGRGRDGRDEDEAGVFRARGVDAGEGKLGLEATVELEFVGGQAELGGDLRDGAEGGFFEGRNGVEGGHGGGIFEVERNFSKSSVRGAKPTSSAG